MNDNWMKRFGIGVLLIWSCMLLWTACGNKESIENEPLDKGGASLTLTVKVAENGMETRGIEDLNNDGNVSADEMCVDGRRMYRLGVFLYDGNSLVQQKVLEANNAGFTENNTVAKVSFENLVYHKNYTLYAVANYGNSESLTGSLASINTNTLMNQLVYAESGSNLCKYTSPYPLSLKITDLNLEPGSNKVSGVLRRTYARLRIRVRNSSALKDLKVTSLSFPENFVQKSAHLFNEGGTANAQPLVTSADAITPFTAGTKVPKIDASGNVAETTIFDTYLLESNGGTYNYTLGLEYGNDNTYNLLDEKIQDMNNVLTDVRAGGDQGGFYLIYNPRTGTYLCTKSNSNKVEADTNYGTDETIYSNYIWNLTHAVEDKTDNTLIFNIQSMGGSKYYMQGTGINASGIPLTASIGKNDYFTLATRSNGLGLSSTASKNNHLEILSSTYEVVGRSHDGNENNDNQQVPISTQRFWFYKVGANSQGYNSAPIPHTETVPIRITYKTTGVSSQLTAIKRNDFIDMVVNVSYNEKTGEVTFETSGWYKIDNEITFD